MKPDQSSLVSLFAQAVRQSGIGILFAGVFGVAVMRIYDDLGRQNAAIVELVREQVSSSREVAAAIDRLTERLDRREVRP
jgi:hypothetical protein